MIDKQAQMQMLHNRAVNGESLTSEERALLDAWYDEQDQLEYDEIIGEPKSFPALPLQQLLDELAVATEQLQTVLSENEQLKAQNDQLRRTIAQQLQPA